MTLDEMFPRIQKTYSTIFYHFELTCHFSQHSSRFEHKNTYNIQNISGSRVDG